MTNLLATDHALAMKWLHEPSKWRLLESALELWPDRQTDFWQRTHYGFRNDSGHLYHVELGGDFDLQVQVTYTPVHQYDQAGLMVYFSEDNWLKCSVEGEPDEPFRLGAVVTRDGWSDWSTRDFEGDRVDVGFRLARAGDDFTVRCRQAGVERWTQIRLAHLPGGTARVGLYACSPKDAGFSARFTNLLLA